MTDPLTAAILTIPIAINTVRALVEQIKNEKRDGVRAERLSEIEDQISLLNRSIIDYADAHFQLRDWKALHDHLSKVEDMLDAPTSELARGDFESFSGYWRKLKGHIDEIRLKPLESLPERWDFETPEGVLTSEWREQLRLYTDRVNTSTSADDAGARFLALRELVRALMHRANAHLIELAGDLADKSSELRGRLQA